EDRQAAEQDAAWSETVRQGTGGHEKSSEGKDIRADDPLDVREFAVQVAGDGGKRYGDDIRVEHDEEGGPGGAQQHPRLSARQPASWVLWCCHLRTIPKSTYYLSIDRNIDSSPSAVK